MADRSKLLCLTAPLASPDRMRWFLASRVIPELGLTSLVAGDEARIVAADTLRFSRAEIASLFDDERHLALGEPELDAVFDGTEGWPTAVQLYRLALGSEGAGQCSLSTSRMSS